VRKPLGVKEAQEVVDVDEEETKRRGFVTVSKILAAPTKGIFSASVCWIYFSALRPDFLACNTQAIQHASRHSQNEIIIWHDITV